MKMNNLQKKLLLIITFVVFLIIVGIIEYYLLSMMTDVLDPFTGPNTFNILGTLAFMVLGSLMIVLRMNILIRFIREYDTWEKITFRMLPQFYLEILLKGLGFVFILNGIIILSKWI
jgi:hypothetical protein